MKSYCTDDYVNPAEPWQHVPVLPREVADLLHFEGAARIVDGTLGNGGHSAILLQANPQLELLGIDRDGAALGRAEKRLAFAAGRVQLQRGAFSELKAIAAMAGWPNADGILLDIGVSSPQLDDGGRGFSWRSNGPLDMRMDNRSELTASRIVNRWTEAELVRIFREYGEVRSAGKLAARLVERRNRQPFATTGELAAFVEEVLGRSRPGVLPTPTLVFQALRIAVNDELNELGKALEAALELLRPGGRLVVISFHSLEDRLVKNFFRERARGCICPPQLPVCVCGHRPELKLLTRHVVTAAEDELAANRRAAPAKLRAAEKC